MAAHAQDTTAVETTRIGAQPCAPTCSCATCRPTGGARVDASAAHLLSLQRAVGNRALAAHLQRRRLRPLQRVAVSDGLGTRDIPGLAIDPEQQDDTLTGFRVGSAPRGEASAAPGGDDEPGGA